MLPKAFQLSLEFPKCPEMRTTQEAPKMLQRRPERPPELLLRGSPKSLPRRCLGIAYSDSIKLPYYYYWTIAGLLHDYYMYSALLSSHLPSTTRTPRFVRAGILKRLKHLNHDGQYLRTFSIRAVS